MPLRRFGFHLLLLFVRRRCSRLRPGKARAPAARPRQCPRPRIPVRYFPNGGAACSEADSSPVILPAAGIAVPATGSCETSPGAAPERADFNAFVPVAGVPGAASARCCGAGFAAAISLCRTLRGSTFAISALCSTCRTCTKTATAAVAASAAAGIQAKPPASPPGVRSNRRAPRSGRRHNLRVSPASCANATTCRHRPHTARCCEHLAAFPLAQRLLGKCAQALRIGMEIVLCRRVHCAACSWNVSVCEFCSSFFRFRSRSRGSAPSASCAARRLRPPRCKIRAEPAYGFRRSRAAACG